MAERNQITEAISLADKTGVSDGFALSNAYEMKQPVDPQSLPEMQLSGEDMAMAAKWEPEQPSFQTAPKSMYQRVFGYDPNTDLNPGDYQNKNALQRAFLRAHLLAQNITRRAGIGATVQGKGTLKFFMPKSMEEFFEIDKIGTQDSSLEEDTYYERSQQKHLREKAEGGAFLSEEEEEQLEYLDEVLPSGIARSPEFVGRVAMFVEEIALAHTVASSISFPGGDTLNSHLSEVGRRMLGRLIPASMMTGDSLTAIGIRALAKSIEMLGPGASELFAYGVITDDSEKSRLVAGAKTVPWAVVSVLAAPVFAPIKTSVARSSLGMRSKDFFQRVVTKTVSPIGDRLGKMKSASAKKEFVKKAVVEADDMYFQETGKYMDVTTKKQVKQALVNLADETANIAKKSNDEITAVIERMAGENLSRSTVGQESVIPASLRIVKEVGDDAVNQSVAYVEKVTPYTSVRQPNGNYAILNTNDMSEVAVDIKRKNLSKKLTETIFGAKDNAPKKNAHLLPRNKQTKITVNQEAELKRQLRRMEVATRDAYRAGVKDANEKAAIQVKNYQERINTIRQGNQEQWKNVEFARQLVKDFVPKEDHGRFMARLIKAKTEGSLISIMDDIQKHLDRKRVGVAIDGLRSSLKQASSRYSDKTGKFAKAPDEVRPMLESLDKMAAGLTKTGRKIGETGDSLAGIADDMVEGINTALAGRGEVLGISDEIAASLYGLEPGQKVSADTIESLANVAKVVMHRIEQADQIRIGSVLANANDVADDAVSRIIPRSPQKASGTMASNIVKAVGPDSDHPSTLIAKMFGSDSKAMTMLDDLYAGETRAYGVMRDSYSIVKDYMAANKISDDIFNSLEKKVDIVVGGQKLTITRNDLLGLAMSTRDPWVFEQLMKSEGLSFHGYKGVFPPMTTDEIAGAISKLTDDELKFGGAMFDLNGKYLSQVVNSTSLELNGIKLATYPQYYPSHRSRDIKFTGKSWTDKMRVLTAETQSNFLPRIGGTKPMRINPYTRELMDYIQNASMYNGTSVPMRSIKTVFNNTNISRHLEMNGYSDELSAFRDIISRSEGLYSDSSVVDAIGSDLLNRFTKAKLGGRISTIGTQIGSVPAAKTVIPRKYFRPHDIASPSRVQELIDNSDFFWYRWTGRRVSVELGDAASTSSIDHFLRGRTPAMEKPMSGMVWGDKKAIDKIYKAARRYLADTKNLSGDELTMQAVALAEHATRQTQPNWSVLTRSKLATDPSVFKRSFTMFRTAQEAQLNILKRAHAEYARTGNKKQLAEGYMAVSESVANVAIWKALWKHGRKAGIAGVGGWLGYGIVNNDDLSGYDVAKELIRTGAGLAPLGKEIESLAEVAVARAMGDGRQMNLSEDPISSIMQAGSEASQSLGKWLNVWAESRIDTDGKFTVDMLPKSIDEMIADISESELDRKQKKEELTAQITRDIINALDLAGTLTGTPTAPLDEWVHPAVTRSKFAVVNKINSTNATNVGRLTKNLNKFMTEYSELQSKSERAGLSEEEAAKAFKMKIFKQANIDVRFSVLDSVGHDIESLLDPVDEALLEFYK